jgi:outer membrane protein assembly factor BamA
VKHSCTYLFVTALLILGCSSVKHVPDGQYLLNKANITIDDRSVNKETLRPFLRQTPNQSVFRLFRLQLGVYNLSGKDSSSWLNRWLQRAGEKPVIFEEQATQASQKELLKELQNRGYAKAEVNVNEVRKKKKIDVTYIIHAGKPYKISSYKTDLINDSLQLIFAGKQNSYSPVVSTGSNFDTHTLDKERTQISSFLRQKGFYNVTKEAFRFTADTTIGNMKTNLILKLRPDLTKNDTLSLRTFTRKKIRQITFVTAADRSQGMTRDNIDSLFYEGYRFLFMKKPIISPSSLVANTFIYPDTYYNDKSVEETYSSLNTLPPVKYVNIVFRERSDNLLDCFIIITPDKNQSVTIDVEGTNSGGNFGGAADFSWQHRNIFGGAQLFKFHVRGSYESLGNLSNIFSYSATEIGTDVSVKYPTFLFPFLSRSYKRGLNASTLFSIGYNYQVRPEFTRTLANAGIKYAWSRGRNTFFTFDLLNLNYIYLPPSRIDTTFKKQYLNNSSPLRFSYENQMIVRTGLSMHYNNQRTSNPEDSYVNWRWSVSESGNLLNGICHLVNAQKDGDGAFRIFNIRFAQFVKGDYDFTYNQRLSQDNRMVYHLNLGVACPMGNAEIIPFVERYFAGGANGVRGWSSYSLGPGAYPNNSGTIDFVNHTGDIKMEANLEYRFKMFWKFEGAVFTDAGNIWSIRNYDFQPDGLFKFNTFYKQIALSYGLGLRLNFDYFIFRVDLGHKLYNPALAGIDGWIKPLSNPQKNMALFLAIGYPF